MKKILLITAITLLIFQMVVLATAIDMGDLTTNRSDELAGPNTLIAKGNPANATGTITQVEIWCTTYDISNAQVATFFVVSGNNLSTRDWEDVGSVAKDAKRTFNVNIDVEEGDYIGLYYVGGRMEIDTTGSSGAWYTGSDKVPCTNQLFTSTAGWAVSIHATGATAEEEEEANAIFFGTNF